MRSTRTGVDSVEFLGIRWPLGYLFLLPLLVFFSIVIYPLLRIVFLSFYSVNFLNPEMKQFVGSANYWQLFARASPFLPALSRSLVWVAASVGLKTVLGLFGALLFHQEFPGRKIYRGLSIIPWGIPWAISAMMWGWTYNTQYGIVNALLERTGIVTEPIGFLSHPEIAFASLVVVDVWIGLPFMIIILEAGLKSIPTHLYEAARVDGAAPWYRLWHVTLPQLKGVLLTATLLSTVWTFNSFDPIWVLTQGGPLKATQTLPIAIYNTGFRLMGGGNLGQAAAMTIAQVVVVSVIAYFYLRSLRGKGEDLV